MSNAAPTPAPKRRRRWLRWTLLGLFLLVAGLLLAAQPIAFYLARRQIAQLGAEQQLDIRYQLEGSIWSRLSVRSVDIQPTGPNALSTFKVGEISVGYDLWRLLRGGLGGDFLGDVVLRDVDVALDPSKLVAKATEQSPTKPFEVPQFPLPASLVLERVNVRIKGGVQLAGLTLRLLPGREDELSLSSLEVPGLRPLGPLRAATSYAERRVNLRGLPITPAIALETLSLTPRGVLDARLRVEGGTATLHAELAPALTATLRAEGVGLRWPAELLTAAAPLPLAGRLDRLEAEFAQLVGPQAGATAKFAALLTNPTAGEHGAASVKVEAEGSNSGDFTRLADWQGQGAAELAQPRSGPLALDAVRVRGALATGGALALTSAEIARATNRLTLSGQARLVGELEASAKFELNAPDLGQLSLAGQAPPVLGQLQGRGEVSWRAGRPQGQVQLEGSQIQAQGVVVDRLRTRLRAADGLLWLDEVDVRFDAVNRLALGGYGRIEGARDFRLEINAELPELERFAATLQTRGISQKLAGGVQLKWLLTGQAGDPAALRSTLGGGGDLAVRELKIDAGAPISADLTATLAGERIELSKLSARSGELEISATARVGDGVAALESIRLLRAGEPLLAGYARVPFDLAAGRLTEEEKIDVDLATARPLALDALWRAAGRPGAPPAAGTLALSLKARGGLKSLVLDLGVQGRELRSPKLEKLRAAEVDLSVGFRAGRATVDGTIRQPQLQPIALKVALPLDLDRLRETKTLPKETPLEGSVRLPPSDLRALLGVVPGLRYIEGQAGIDVTLSGTVGAPRLRGQSNLNIPAARFENLSIPALRGVKFRLGFTDQEATVEQGEAEVAGGRLNVRGKATFPSAAQAAVDFAVQGKDLLVVRDEGILVRTNADVKIAGPLSAATVSGRIGLTKSRFLKDIEIVPLPLPGDKKAPPSAPPPPRPRGTGAELGIQTPPLRDWKFDLVIKTDDPFRVSGNLARGRLAVDLKLTGTGGSPQLEGPVNIEQLSAKLPFSRLDVERGSLYFTPDQPLNPLIDLSGASQVRDRRVNISVFGRANDPKTAFSSEPPLPQEQILTLLATGATLDELRDNSGALAGKALVLAAQRVYRKLFPSKSRGPEEDSFLDRFDLDVGNADPKTGAQTVAARYRVSDRVIILSDFDQEGHFRGRVKYLIRFK
ncbi:MAG: translocation/assembly module TamB domain-containing protein [Verrucomicrobia bacterium]|nr:translocation/assembly module TamB domain-containing protein [Verrucomicrobiota bacterium]